MHLRFKSKGATDELLERQQAELDSFVIRTELFSDALKKATENGDPARLAATKNMLASFIASAQLFEQKWQKQRADFTFSGPTLLSLNAMSEKLASCAESLKGQ